MKRRSVAGKDHKGEHRGNTTAAEALERLRGVEVSEGLRAAKDPEAFEAQNRREEKAHGLVEGARPSPERVMMQALGVPLELQTVRHDSLARTFPWLVRWIVHVLTYVVDLEAVVEGDAAVIKRDDATIDRLRLAEADASATAEALRAEVAELKRGGREILTAHGAEVSRAAGEERVLTAERDAARASVAACVLALRIVL